MSKAPLTAAANALFTLARSACQASSRNLLSSSQPGQTKRSNHIVIKPSSPSAPPLRSQSSTCSQSSLALPPARAPSLSLSLSLRCPTSTILLLNTAPLWLRIEQSLFLFTLVYYCTIPHCLLLLPRLLSSRGRHCSPTQPSSHPLSLSRPLRCPVWGKCTCTRTRTCKRWPTSWPCTATRAVRTPWTTCLLPRTVRRLSPADLPALLLPLLLQVLLQLAALETLIAVVVAKGTLMSLKIRGARSATDRVPA